MTISLEVVKNREDLIINSIGILFEKMILLEDNNNNEVIKVYNSSKLPCIAIVDYLKRLNNYANYSIECNIIALIYINRIIEKDIYFNKISSHRILASCTILSIKYLEDKLYDNNYLARVCGLTLSEMNRLELYTLKLFDYKLYVSDDEYNRYYKILKNLVYKHFNVDID